MIVLTFSSLRWSVSRVLAERSSPKEMTTVSVSWMPMSSRTSFSEASATTALVQ